MRKETFQKGERALPWPRLGSVIGEEEIKVVTELLQESATKRKSLRGRERVEKFEQEFSDYVGAKHAVAVSSCGAALVITAKILGIKEGDEVITTPITHVSTATSVMGEGAKPVFVDIDKRTFNLDPAKIEEKITQRTKAIYPTHYGGLPVDMDPVLEIAKKHSLYVVEDAAHAPGAEYKGRKVGSLGDMTCFSFQTQKNMTTLGEGGMITTDNDEFAQKAQLLRSFGVVRYKNQTRYWEPWHYDVTEIATNLRMTNLQGAVGSVQLAKLDKMNEDRREKAYYLTENLQCIEGITTPYERSGDKHAYHIYNLLFDEEKIGTIKSDFIAILHEEYNIEPIIHYLPVYLLTLFKRRGYREGQCPVAEEAFRELLALPLHPSYTQDDLDYMITAVKEAVERLRN